jgi:hypothetical protein
VLLWYSRGYGTSSPIHRRDTMKIRHNAEEIIKILHSIRSVSFGKDGELYVYFNGDIVAMTKKEFVKGSFTRSVLKIIEGFLLETE